MASHPKPKEDAGEAEISEGTHLAGTEKRKAWREREIPMWEFSQGQTEGPMEDNHQKTAKTGRKGTALAWGHDGVHHPLGTPWECEWTICLMLLKDKCPHPWDKQPLAELRDKRAL